MGKLLHLPVGEYAKILGYTEVLTSRPLGTHVLNETLKKISNVQAETVIECSFEGIEICDYSFVDEFLLNLQLKVLAWDNTILRIVDCKIDVLENIKATLLLRNDNLRKQAPNGTKINILYFHDGRYNILGPIEKGLVAAFDNVIAHPECVTVRNVAEALEISSLASIANRLKRLYDSRLICRREEVDETGRQFLYFVPEV